MSGNCNVCGQMHAEIKHCAFKEEMDELSKENQALRKENAKLKKQVKWAAKLLKENKTS